jgi:hypothetical protein
MLSLYNLVYKIELGYEGLGLVILYCYYYFYFKKKEEKIVFI